MYRWAQAMDGTRQPLPAYQGYRVVKANDCCFKRAIIKGFARVECLPRAQALRYENLTAMAHSYDPNATLWGDDDQASSSGRR